MRFGKALADSVAQPGGGVVQGFFVVVAYFLVAGCTVFNPTGWPCDHSLVGIGFVDGSGISLVAFRAAFFQMNVLRQTLLCNQKPFVSLRDPRRRTGSSVAFARALVVILVLDHRFELICAAMARKTGVGGMDVWRNNPG